MIVTFVERQRQNTKTVAQWKHLFVEATPNMGHHDTDNKENLGTYVTFPTLTMPKSLELIVINFSSEGIQPSFGEICVRLSKWKTIGHLQR